MIQMAYISGAQKPFTPAQLDALLARARSNNLAAGITGVLLYLEGSFLQVLEGDDEIVEQTFDRISRDIRHGRVQKLFVREIDERDFGDWRMGFVRHGPAVEGFAPFLRDDLTATGAAATADRVLKVIDQFREGRWRQKITGS